MCLEHLFDNILRRLPREAEAYSKTSLSHMYTADAVWAQCNKKTQHVFGRRAKSWDTYSVNIVSLLA